MSQFRDQRERRSTDHRPLVFFVDDEPDILDVFEIHFGERYEVRCFARPEEALAALTDPSTPWPDAVVTDFRMPRMNGIEFLSRMLEYGCKTRAILLSGNLDKDVAIRAANRGVFQILEKPFDGREVELALDSLLVERRAELVREDIRSQVLKLKELYSSMRLLMTSRVPEFDDILREYILDKDARKADGTFETELEDLEHKLEELLRNHDQLASLRKAA